MLRITAKDSPRLVTFQLEEMNMVALRNQSEIEAGHAGNLRRLQLAVEGPDESVLAGLSIAERKLLQQLLSGPYEYVRHPDFGRLRDLLDQRAAAERPEGSPTVPAALAAKRPSRTGSLSAEQERRLFIQFNYARYRTFCLLRRHRGRRLGNLATRALLHWNKIAEDTRAAIVDANTPLVLALASRARDCSVELAELISEGNLALLRSVDKFDCSRGYKFSTYARRAILASFSQAIRKRARYCAHYGTSLDRAIRLDHCMDPGREHPEIESLEELRRVLFENTADLSAVERCVLDARFSLNVFGESEPARPRTLNAVGTVLGGSKDGVRRIQNQALGKLRTMLEWRLHGSNTLHQRSLEYAKGVSA